MAARPDIETIQKLLRENYHGIHYLATVHEGLSGAVVLLVKYRLRGAEGLAFAKVDRTESCRYEIQKHADARLRLREGGGDTYVPRLITQEPQILADGYAFVLYEPAHHVPNTARSLGSALAANRYSAADLAAQVEGLLARVIAHWHHAEHPPVHIPVLLRRVLTTGDLYVPPKVNLTQEQQKRLPLALAAARERKEMEKLTEIDDRALQFDLPGPINPVIIFQPGGVMAPNPLAYLMNETLWVSTREIVAPQTPVHGDLHSGNIICDMESGGQVPWVIDFARFDSEGVPFFDLAYLELDLLMRCLPADTPEAWEDWLALTEFLTSTLAPSGEPRRSATLRPWRLIQPIRRYAQQLVDSVADRPGYQGDYVTAWWVSAAVAGTIFARRSRLESPEQRVVLLLYAARSLKRLLETVDVKMPGLNAYPVWWGESPWEGKPFIGLKAFTPEQAPIFYGRDQQTQELLALVSKHRIVVVTGASGAGKSSLVGAGLLPRLSKNAIPGSRHWQQIRFTPDENPFASLKAALTMHLCPGEQQLETRLRQDPGLLESLSDRYLLDKDGQLLLFIDQFEELFTLVLSERDRREFIHLLTHIVTSARLRVVLTVRSDFFPVIMEHTELVQLIQGRQYIVTAPGEADLRAMIERPARRAKVDLEEGLVSAVISDSNVRGNPGALALMAYTLEQIQDQSGGHRLTLAAYEALGRVQGAIEKQADRTFDSLDPATRDEALAFVFQNLISVSVDVDKNIKATRQRVSLDTFKGSDAALDFIERFTQARLLVKTDDAIEIAHEALLRSWKRLVQWIEHHSEDIQRRQKLERDAADWDKSGRTYYLQHEQRQPYIEMIRRLKPRLSLLEQTFLRPEQDWLLADLDKPGMQHVNRANIGDRLAAIGDTRPGLGTKEGTPTIELCTVPEGVVEVEGKRYAVPGFRMAKYPVTYAQFRAFLSAEDGARPPGWWEGLGERHRQNNQDDLQARKLDNCPADRVSWYGAVAFCRWLTARYRAAMHRQGQTFPDALEFRLPTEWEWQWAAQGGDARRMYPWGDLWDGSLAATRENGLARSIAVGMYPGGAAVCGALDLSGGVWEWCLNEYADTERIAPNPHEDERVLRGGSWSSMADQARTTFRARVEPFERFDNQGFRVVLGAALALR